MAGDAPQRRLDLGHQEKDPTVHLGAFFHSAGDETRLWIFLGQVELYRGRFGDDLAAIDQHRNLGGGVEREEIRLKVLPLQEIDRDLFILQAEFVEHPDDAQHAGRRRSVEFHHVPAPSIGRHLLFRLFPELIERGRALSTPPNEKSQRRRWLF